MNKKEGFLEKFDLTGRYALITGGAGLLGTEHARAILCANGNVILWDLDSELLSKTLSKLESEFGKNRILPKSSITELAKPPINILSAKSMAWVVCFFKKSKTSSTPSKIVWKSACTGMRLLMKA